MTADHLILSPVFDDWDAAGKLIAALDRVLPDDRRWRVLLVDDGSIARVPDGFLGGVTLSRIAGIDVLELRRNLGHQRALAVGLAYVHANIPCKAVVVMDADGEDRPEDVERLLRRFEQEEGRAVVFAERKRRTEGFVFAFFYACYRLCHRVLTGQSVRVGNFSILAPAHLERLSVTSETWNHYAASVFRSRLARSTVPADRGRRLTGRSKMNFISLAAHGLSAISVYSDIVGVRLLLASVAVGALALAGLVATIGIRFATDLAIPGWATYATGILALLLFHAAGLAVVFVFVVLGGRDTSSFLPARDFPYFVARLRQLESRR